MLQSAAKSWYGSCASSPLAFGTTSLRAMISKLKMVRKQEKYIEYTVVENNLLEETSLSLQERDKPSN